MAEELCFTFSTSGISGMDSDQQDKKDVSKVFALLRAKLNDKEKELLELQRANPCLLAPDSEQIDVLINDISSLHLSTQDGSFIFASNSVSKISSPTTLTRSTGIDTIKTLPSNVWVQKSEDDKENKYRLPMVTQLLSLPTSAFVASSTNREFQQSIEEAVGPKSEPPNRLPMVSQLFSMPISAFRSSSNQQNITTTTHAQVEKQKQPINNNTVSPVSDTSKSILTGDSIYSKEYWLRKPKSSTDGNQCESLDLNAYIEKTTDKMRRLHMEYLEALEKLRSPISPTVNSSETIKSMYPNIFNQDMSITDLQRLTPTKK